MKQLVQLERENVIHGIITNDFDLVALGWKKVIILPTITTRKKNGDANQRFELVDLAATRTGVGRSILTADRTRRAIPADILWKFAAWNGCDYGDGIRNVGIAKTPALLDSYERELVKAHQQNDQGISQKWWSSTNPIDLPSRQPIYERIVTMFEYAPVWKRKYDHNGDVCDVLFIIFNFIF